MLPSSSSSVPLQQWSVFHWSLIKGGWSGDHGFYLTLWVIMISWCAFTIYISAPSMIVNIVFIRAEWLSCLLFLHTFQANLCREEYFIHYIYFLFYLKLFYWTHVRSLPCLVRNSVTPSITLLRLDLCDSGV